MEINDVIYGKFKIEEPVIISLINSNPLQRLKGIEQFGVPKEFYTVPGFSRYDHSVGVMLLLRKLGLGIEEQIAGLLHDISHTAFSHVIDWVVGSIDKEDFHENIYKPFIQNSEIPEILSNFGFDTEKITNIENYPILETVEPELCADRLDYGLREFHSWANPEVVKFCIDNLRLHDGKIVFSSKEAADVFGRNFLKCQTEHWGSVEPNIRYHLFSQTLKIALEENIINMKDFYLDDEHVMKKLRSSDNIQINNMLKILSGKLSFKITTQNPQLRLKKKFRYVDPKYIENNIIFRLSETDEDYKAFLEEQRKINEKGINVNLRLNTV